MHSFNEQIMYNYVIYNDIVHLATSKVVYRYRDKIFFRTNEGIELLCTGCPTEATESTDQRNSLRSTTQNSQYITNLEKLIPKLSHTESNPGSPRFGPPMSLTFYYYTVFRSKDFIVFFTERHWQQRGTTAPDSATN